MNLRALLVVGLFAAYGCGSTSSSPSTPSNPGVVGTPVAIVSGSSVLTTTAFAPNPVSVAVGGSVTWVNNDNVTHTSTANNASWNSGSIAPGSQFTTTFATAGSYTYHCAIHPGMVGTINVQ